MQSVSFVIPTYNGKTLLAKNLPAVIAASGESDEIIIVDDASTDDTLTWLTREFNLINTASSVEQAKKYTGSEKNREIKVLVNQTNVRFAQSCNRGVASARSAIIVLLNNDVSPKSDFLTYLLPHFEDPNVFAVGCKEIATADNNTENGRSELWFERGMFVHKRASNQNETDTAWVAGGSGAFRKRMWKTLGGFDSAFYPAYWEDTDLSMRAKELGWKVLFEPKSIVYHNHESTNADVFGKKRLEVMGYKNQLLFTWKHARGMKLIKHIVWLPYHLVCTTYRSQGRFLQGFAQAVSTLI